jgi:hypothetical protein
VNLHAEAQSLLDSALIAAPAWSGYALLALSAIVTIPGRHGQRPLNGALIGGGVFALAFLGLRGVLHAWVPGVTAVIAGTVAAAIAMVEVGWSTALVVAILFGGGAALAARWLGIPTWGLWPPAAGLGLFAGMANRKRLSTWLPPLFASLFATLGAAILWAPHWRGAKLWQLNDVDWALGLWGALAVVLLALSLEREYRKRLRLAARTKEMQDEQLKKKIEAQQSAYRRAFEKLQSLPEDDG